MRRAVLRRLATALGLAVTRGHVVRPATCYRAGASRLVVHARMLCTSPAPPPDWSSLTVKQLQQQLRERNLRVSGRKSELIERLAGASGPSGAAAAAAKPKRAGSSGATSGARGRAAGAGGASVGGGAIPRDETPRRSASPSPSTLRVVSWNIAGLRGLLKREEGVRSLRELVDVEGADVLMLQETKLQEMHVEAVEAQLLDALGQPRGTWRAAWACSTARKGYSGVCTLWRDGGAIGAVEAEAARCEPLSVDPSDEAELEGRTLLLTLPLREGRGSAAPQLRLTNVYTPNSGAALGRLAYRTGAGGWDERFFDAVGAAHAAAGPGATCVGGDLNVAVEDIDFFNPSEKRMEAQAGTTPEERASFRRMLAADADGEHTRLVDAFRACHPAAAGQYTYWSQRARNRPRNRGLRIDYFLLDPAAARGALVDAQHLHALEGSDHCPLMLELDTARIGA